MARRNLDTPDTQLRMVRQYAQQYASLRTQGHAEEADRVAHTLDKLLRVIQHTAPTAYNEALGIVSAVAVAAAPVAPAGAPSGRKSARDNSCRTTVVPRANVHVASAAELREAAREQAEMEREHRREHVRKAARSAYELDPDDFEENETAAMIHEEHRAKTRTPRANNSRSSLDAKAEALSQEQSAELAKLSASNTDMPRSRLAYYAREHAALREGYAGLRDNRSKRSNRSLPPGAIIITEQMSAQTRRGTYHAPPYFTPKDVPPHMLALVKQMVVVRDDPKATADGRKAAETALKQFSTTGVIPPQGLDALQLNSRDPQLVRANRHLVTDDDKRAYLRAAQTFFERVAFLADKFRPLTTKALTGAGLTGDALDAAYNAVEDALSAARMHDRVDEMRRVARGGRQSRTLLAPPGGSSNGFVIDVEADEVAVRPNRGRRGKSRHNAELSPVFSFSSERAAWDFMHACDKANIPAGFPATLDDRGRVMAVATPQGRGEGWKSTAPKVWTVTVAAASAAAAQKLLHADATPVVDGDTGAFPAVPRKNSDLTDADFLKNLKNLARNAAEKRLDGQIQAAQVLDRELDRLHIEAERRGLGDRAVRADEQGRQAAR